MPCGAPKSVFQKKKKFALFFQSAKKVSSKNDGRPESGSAHRPLGQNRTYSLHLLRLFIQRSKDSGNRLLRRTNMSVAGGSGDAGGDESKRNPLGASNRPFYRSFNLFQMTPRCLLVGHTAPVLCLSRASLATEQNYIVSSSESGEMCTWDLVDGKCREAVKLNNIHTQMLPYVSAGGEDVRLFCSGWGICC